MSRIFDVQLEKSGMYYVQSNCGHSRFRASKYGVAGPNQILLPSYIEPQSEELISWSQGATGKKVATNLDEVARESHGKELLAHKIEYSSGDLQVVRSNVKQYVEATTHMAANTQVLQLAPMPIVNSNKATYYLRIESLCPKLDFVELAFGTGDTLLVNGNFELYGRDKSLLSVLAKIPGRSKFKISYAQILPKKDSILKILSRAQYGQNPLQP